MCVFFGEVCVKVFVSFLIWLFVFLLPNSKSFFSILGCILCKYFSQSVTYLFLLTFSFTEPKFLVFWVFLMDVLHVHMETYIVVVVDSIFFF